MQIYCIYVKTGYRIYGYRFSYKHKSSQANLKELHFDRLLLNNNQLKQWSLFLGNLETNNHVEK